MLKKFQVDGHTVWVEEDFDDFREKFKGNVAVDDMDNWKFKNEMEEYTATSFMAKARYCLMLTPPKIILLTEKAWSAAVYAVKELYLSAGNIDINSHNALSFFSNFAIDCSDIPFEQRLFLRYNCWASAERLHRDVYGSRNSQTREYPDLITNIGKFVTTFAKMDRKHLFSEFQKAFMTTTVPGVEVRKLSGYVKLGGVNLKRDYVVFV